MASLLNSIKHITNEVRELPFSIYASYQEQRLLNVPIAKPLLIAVLNGEKALGQHHEILCPSNHFIFLPNSPAINMRNIPKDKTYFALIIEFNYEDFNGLQTNHTHQKNHLIGELTPALEACLQQFIEATRWAPQALLSLRKREIISLLCHLGHQDILAFLSNPQTKDQLHTLFTEQGYTLTNQAVCHQLAMSESTLRRKLKFEGTSLQEVKDQARMGLALHLLQTTLHPIGLIADRCGYQSQSRFTDRFKLRFGLTPSELRKTILTA